ncbi:methionine adenosyltransferase domain-containing protein [Patescibacteria group bacterium]|nr:methionine adenosyltransferase domain-containing protein [Patescibacteria group bacterium]
MTEQTFTAEYVSPGHPDKICDRISDRILQAFCDQDPYSRVAVEVMGGHGHIYVLGEVTSRGKLSDKDIRNIIIEIIGSDNYDIAINLVQQSPEIAHGVDEGGAGDQGIVVGYACNHNEDMVPQEYYLARSLCEYLYALYPYDGKTQITINNKHEITVIVASFQHSKTEELQNHVNDWLTKNSFSISDTVECLLNPAGEWSVGGFDADTGLTGRKIVVDSYGPRVPVGGGAFSGKDWTKVDRSGAMYARHIAQTLLKQQGAREVRVELAYAIGVSDAVQSIAYVDGTPYTLDDFDTSMTGIQNYITSL